MARTERHGSTPEPVALYDVHSPKGECVLEGATIEKVEELVALDRTEIVWAIEEHGFASTDEYSVWEHIPLVSAPSLRIAGCWLVVGLFGLAVAAALLMV
jgi:hypothetical protein